MSDQEEENIKLFDPRRGSSLDESQLEYTLILVVDKKTGDGPEEEKMNAKVDQEYEEMLNYVEQIAEGYIWNNERFYLNKPVMFRNSGGSSSDDKLAYYTTSGIIDYGDNIEDEWYVVYLLYKLSEKYPNLMCQCVDSDGEFMLIQAANHLPHWASHATHMTNRVFIHRGKLHLIPPAHSPAHITYVPQAGSLTNYIQSASHTILDFPSVTEASASIQQCIKKKTGVFDIDNYSFHRATCYMPTKLAILLKNNPHLISKAINRFCDKDPSDMRLCRTLTSFKPVDMINYRVLFTKHLYSKLKYSELRPDKRHHWPPVESSAPNETREKSTLGFKLTCAFEILSKVVLQNERGAQSKSFDAYVKRLQNLGYFRNYLENSKKYNELYEIARESFDANNGQATSSTGVTIIPTVPTAAVKSSSNPVSASAETTDSATTNLPQPLTDTAVPIEKEVAASIPAPPTPSALPSANLDQYARLMDSIYLDKLLDRDYIVKIKEEISTSQDAEKDDSEEWLCVDAPQLDDYLEMYSRGDVGSTYDFRLITTALKNFINKDRSKTSSTAAATAAAATAASSAKKEDVDDGVEFNPIDRRLSEDDVLVDFNVDSIEENIREFLKKAENKNKKEGEKGDEEDEEEDEDDSFYAVGGDEVDDTEDYETNKLSDSLKTYMSSMDEELREFKSLSRLEASGPTSSGKKDEKKEGEKDNKETAAAEELDIDMNLVTNALESYSSQLGLTGPVSNILKSLGI